MNVLEGNKYYLKKKHKKVTLTQFVNKPWKCIFFSKINIYVKLIHILFIFRIYILERFIFTLFVHLSINCVTKKC